jgi:deazaflavin-dependent oxidoreductase (nitroreductase family)
VNSTQELTDALQGASEVRLTVTGRKSGQEITVPIWFVEDEDRLLLMPIHGTDTGWYRNIAATPEIRLDAAAPSCG